MEGNTETGFRFLGNSLEVHAEESEQEGRPAPAVPEGGEEARAGARKSGTGPGLKERKRTNTEDDVVGQKVPPDLPPVKPVVPGANSDLVEKAKSIVEKAVKQHKVFVMFGQYGTVKRGLKRRGWLEKPCDCCRVSR